MSKLTLFAFFVSVPLFAAPSFQCELKARPNVYQPFEAQQKTFEGEMLIKIDVQDFTAKFQSVIVEGKNQLSLLLKHPSGASAATMVSEDVPSAYLNLMIQQEQFAVVECKRI